MNYDHAKFFTGAYERRLIPVAGHNLPQENPDAVVKGTVVREMLAHETAARALARPEKIPAAALELAANPPAVTAWVSEVHFLTLFAAIYDANFICSSLGAKLKSACNVIR